MSEHYGMHIAKLEKHPTLGLEFDWHRRRPDTVGLHIILGDGLQRAHRPSNAEGIKSRMPSSRPRGTSANVARSTCIVHLLLNFRRGVHRVDGSEHGAQRHDGEENHGELDAIGRQEQDDVGLAHPQGLEQPRGHDANAALELRVGEGAARRRVHQRRAGAPLRGKEERQQIQVARGRKPHRRTLAVEDAIATAEA